MEEQQRKRAKRASWSKGCDDQKSSDSGGDWEESACATWRN